MTTAADPVFLDTGVLLAATVDAHPANAVASGYIAKLVATETPLCVSPQILRELYVVLTRQPVEGRAFSTAEATASLTRWREACVLLSEDDDVVGHWRRLIERFGVRGKQAHDCNVVAVTKANGVSRLATRNPKDFERYGDEISLESLVS